MQHSEVENITFTNVHYQGVCIVCDKKIYKYGDIDSFFGLEHANFDFLSGRCAYCGTNTIEMTLISFFA